MNHNVVVRFEKDVLIIVHNEHPPLDDEWDVYVNAYAQKAADVNYQLVFTAGGGPNAAQRKRANLGEANYKRLNKSVPQTAVLTPSAAMRGLVTLFNWFFPNRYKAFEPTDFGSAFEYVGLRSNEHEKFYAFVESMRKEVR